MQKISNVKQSQLLQIWIDICQQIKDSFGLISPERPTQIFLSVLDDYQPGIIDGNSIIINSSLPNYETVLPATIAKLCLERVLPADILCKECVDDLSFEFSRRAIKDESVRSHWESLWSEYAPPQKVSQVMEYYPVVGYKWLHSVAGEQGLNVLIRELSQRAKNQVPLSFEDYMQYFSTRVRRFENTLDTTELKLIRAIVDSPDLQASQLADLVGVSEEWISRKLSHLQKRMILRKFHRAPFSRIGINMYQVLVSRRDSEQDLFPFLKDCPFLFSYRKMVSGSWIALATLCIPENRESMRYLKIGLKQIVEAGFDIELHQIQSAGNCYCFDYYQPENGQWDIPWELLSIHLQRIKSDNLASSIPRIDKPENRVTIELDELDMRIFESVSRGFVSVSKIRAHLKVGQHRIAERVQKLRENGLVIKSWELHNIGLNEHAIIYCKEKEMGKTIAAWSLRLPRSLITFSAKDELMLIADLPRGGSFGLATALEGLNNNTCVGVLSPQTYGMWGFPSPLWDTKYQRWKCPKKRLETWILELT